MEHFTLRAFNPKSITRAAAVAAMLFSFACKQDQADAPKEEPTLGAVRVPDGFTMATTKSASLTIASKQAGAVQIARLDDKVLYRGAIASDGTLSVKVYLPTKDDDVRVKLISSGETRESTVSVLQGTTTVSFE